MPAATLATLGGRIFHPVVSILCVRILTDGLRSEKTLDRQHAKQQRDPKTFAHMIDEVTHDGLLCLLDRPYSAASACRMKEKMSFSSITIPAGLHTTRHHPDRATHHQITSCETRVFSYLSGIMPFTGQCMPVCMPVPSGRKYGLKFAKPGHTDLSAPACTYMKPHARGMRVDPDFH